MDFKDFPQEMLINLLSKTFINKNISIKKINENKSQVIDLICEVN